jgi:hypothetical protein
MWIPLTEPAVLSKLSGPELAAMKTAAIASGQANPLPEVIAQVTREIRGYAAACSKNTLGPSATIPDELLGAAINRVRYELATRLPVASLLTQVRQDANRDALRMLERASECKVTLEQPAVASTEKLSSTGAKLIRPGTGFNRKNTPLL